MDASAMHIANELLEKSGEILKNGDYEAFCDCFTMPTIVSSSEGTSVMSSKDDLIATVKCLLEKYATMGVTDQVRIVEAARFRSATQIASTHVTHLLAGARRLNEPYPVFSLIELQEDEQWRVSYSDYAVGARSPQAVALHNSPSPGEQA